MFKLQLSQIFGRFFKFSIVGLFVNSFGYLLYIALSFFITPLDSIKISYFVGAVTSLILNKTILFKNCRNKIGFAIFYLLLYVAGFIINFLCMYLNIIFNLIPHQLMQLFLVLLIAILNFYILESFYKLNEKKNSIQ